MICTNYHLHRMVSFIHCVPQVSDDRMTAARILLTATDALSYDVVRYGDTVSDNIHDNIHG